MRPGRRSSGKLHLPVSVVKPLGQGFWLRTAASPGKFALPVTWLPELDLITGYQLGDA